MVPPWSTFSDAGKPTIKLFVKIWNDSEIVKSFQKNKYPQEISLKSINSWDN